MQRLLSDAELRGSLIRSGLQNVQRFSWSETARQTLDVYRKVAPSTPSRPKSGRV